MSLRAISTAALAFSAAAQAQSNIDIQCPTKPLPFVYAKDIKLTDAALSIFSGDWKYATEMAGNFIGQYLTNCKNAPNILNTANKIGGQIKLTLNDPAKSESEKRDALYELIDKSILPYEQKSDAIKTPINELNATYQYSLTYGLTRLSFDAIARDDLCSVYSGINLGWKTDLYTGTSFYIGGSYVQARHIRTPSIFIYRQIEGLPDELVVSFSGSVRGGFTGYNYRDSYAYRDVNWQSIQGEAWNKLKARFNGTKDKPITTERASIDIPTFAYLKPGSRLAYRVVQEWPRSWNESRGKACEQSFSAQSVIFIDSDKDGRVDIIPKEVYEKYSSDLNAPAFLLLLN